MEKVIIGLIIFVTLFSGVVGVSGENDNTNNTYSEEKVVEKNIN